MLEVGDGNRIHWEVCGRPDGIPAVVLHGGPGSGCTPTHRRFFDPDRYRVVLFDQRGCGRSTPHAADPATSLTTNTTRHLVADIELLRTTLGIERWLVFGNSWGATLGLAYAEQHPERVHEIVLVAVTLTRPADVDWLYHGARRFFPDAWERFREAVPAVDRDGDLVAAYRRLIEDPDPEVRDRAARAWCRWEDAVLGAGVDRDPDPRYDDPRFRLGFVRLVTHYFHHHAWLADDVLLRHAHRLAGIPGTLVHGRHDVGSPVEAAYLLYRAWPGSRLQIVPAGHGATEAAMTAATVAALDRAATRTPIP
jgi:proline iminopeptidase